MRHTDGISGRGAGFNKLGSALAESMPQVQPHAGFCVTGYDKNAAEVDGTPERVGDGSVDA